ncbi:MAG: SCO family protein [Gemmatimonadetes bacterium]|nr:SCO family protein [Gemmatimonadota bacterium]
MTLRASRLRRGAGAAAIAAVLAAGAMPWRAAAQAAPLPARSLYRLKATWTSHTGRPVELPSLRGETVVLAMVYTSCTMTCPLITGEMQAVRRALPADVRPKVRFVLASFDPDRDSVAALRAHASKMSLDDRWLVLRAPAGDVRQLAVLLGVRYRKLPDGDFDHSNIISVLDAGGVLRHQSPRIPADRAALVRAVTAAARSPGS